MWLKRRCIYHGLTWRNWNEFYLEMVESMKAVAKLEVELTVEERNLLSVAYKNVIGARRASWRIISSMEQKEEAKSTEPTGLTRDYRAKVRYPYCIQHC